MAKISITKTFEGAFRFLFSNVLAIIGIAWLPFAIAIAALAGLAYLVVPAPWLHGTFPTMQPDEVLAIMPRIIGAYGILIFVWIVCQSMVVVGVLRRALGLSSGPTFVYFSLGAPVWRLIGANFLIWLALLVLGGLLTAICAGVIAGGDGIAMNKGLMILLDAIVIIASVCFFVYVAIRWTFFIAPVIVAEDHLGLGRAWQLGRGNFWQILAVVIVVYLPISIVGSIVAQIVISVIGGSSLVTLPDHPTAEQIAAMVHQLFITMVPAFGIASILQMIALLGAFSGAQAIAYREVTAAPE